jgi:flagellar hook protein FlgE
MMRSMFSGVSGLRAHQTMMDVVGDNIANVNTVGFKSSRVVFEDQLSQLLRDGQGAQGTVGGVNPSQVGLGVRVASVDTTDTEGALQNTGRPTDVAIQGAGYLMVQDGTETLYTRAGALNLDNAGDLVDPSGLLVKGWMADAAGTISPNSTLTPIRIPLGQSVPPKVTTTVTVGGNLSADAPTGQSDGSDTRVIPEEVVDSLGQTHKLNITLKHTSDTNRTWDVYVSAADGSAGDGSTPIGTLTFNSDGSLAPLSSPLSFALNPAQGAASTISLDFGKPGSSTALTQFGGSSTAIALDQDGSTAGVLRSYSIGSDGTIVGSFSNDKTKVLGQLALATFADPAGLAKAADSHLRATGASGTPIVGTPGSNGSGTLAAGALEMSNVDLAQEFTNLIVAQRGFQANSKVISASDEMLQDLVNLKR